MFEHLEERALFAYPAGADWQPLRDNPQGTLIFRYELSDPTDFVYSGTATWDTSPTATLPAGAPGPTVTLTEVPAHSEIKVLAQVEYLNENAQQANDATPDGGYVLLNNLVRSTGNYAMDVAHINTGLQVNGGGNTVTVNVGPNALEPGEDLIFTDIQVWIWTPTLTIQHPPSLNEGQNGNVVIARTGGDHGIFPIPVRLAKVAVSQPSPILNPATTDEWTLETNVLIPAVPVGSTYASVTAAISIVDDTEVEPQETAVYRVLPSDVHTEGGTTQQPSGNRMFSINPSDYNPYGGGGYQPQGAFSGDLIASEDDDNYVGELVDSVAGDLFGEIVA